MFRPQSGHHRLHLNLLDGPIKKRTTQNANSWALFYLRASEASHMVLWEKMTQDFKTMIPTVTIGFAALFILLGIISIIELGLIYGYIGKKAPGKTTNGYK